MSIDINMQYIDKYIIISSKIGTLKIQLEKISQKYCTIKIYCVNSLFSH